jgi:hypothetical protein
MICWEIITVKQKYFYFISIEVDLSIFILYYMFDFKNNHWTYSLKTDHDYKGSVRELILE